MLAGIEQLRPWRFHSTNVPMALPQPAAAETAWAVYGGDESYYTGKLEAYLRAKGIAYRVVPFSPRNRRRAARYTGVMQAPQVERPDGSWLVDTTAIIDYVETLHAEPAIHPRSPSVRFISRLLEDFADEWLWRPAMHYRWSYPDSARLVSRWLAAHLTGVPVPFTAKRLYWYARQWWWFVRDDGVNARTRTAVEATYHQTLATLESCFADQPFVLGARPCAADFGFFASMFRHFACDPTPSQIMRDTAPRVFAWVGRMWSLHPGAVAAAAPVEMVPDAARPLVAEATGVYLPYLQAMATAHGERQKRLQLHLQDVDWDEPVKPYRVWCLAELRRRYGELDDRDRTEVDEILGDARASAILAAADDGVVDGPIPALPIRHPKGSPPRDSWWRE